MNALNYGEFVQLVEKYKILPFSEFVLQNFGDVVITGAAKQNGDASGWNSMCYQPSELWLSSIQARNDYEIVEDAKNRLIAELSGVCSDKSYSYFTKKLRLSEQGALEKPSV